ncbi:hypothetical protein LXL04_011316 [Taraxacum kok-saghyz]
MTDMPFPRSAIPYVNCAITRSSHFGRSPPLRDSERLNGAGGKQPAVSATSEFTAGERRGVGEASGKVQRQPDTDGKIRLLQVFSCIYLHITGNGSKKGGHGTSLYSRMADWSDDESDFTEQIAMMAMMGMQRVVEILE